MYLCQAFLAGVSPFWRIPLSVRDIIGSGGAPVEGKQEGGSLPVDPDWVTASAWERRDPFSAFRCENRPLTTDNCRRSEFEVLERPLKKVPLS